jgi:hypothetical protein
LASSERDTGSSSNAKPTPTEEKSSPDIGPESRASRTFELYNPTRSRTQDEHGPIEYWKQDETVDALHGPTGNKEPLICSVEASPAKTSPSRADGRDSQANAQDCSSSSHESPTLFSPNGSSLRTFPDFFPPTVEGISPSYSRRWPSSGFTTSPGECWTADTSECPKGGGAFSSLPDVLEAEVHPRFYLSQRAAAGILRRAEKRGRELPRPLMEALEGLAGQTTTTRREGSSSPTPSEAKDSTPQGTERGAVRRLSPTECERLQGFPNGWTVV